MRSLSVASSGSGNAGSRSDPQQIVVRAYSRHWARNYSRDDPRYVPTVDEEIAFIRSVTADRLREFHADFFGASHAEVVVVGDFDPDEVRGLIAERLDGWRSPKPFDDILNLYSNLATDPTSERFETPDKENAFILAGMPLEMQDSHPDYPALVLGNYILGGGPAARLFTRIRGSEGLSYGIYSGFSASPRSTAAQFTVNGIAAPQNIDRVEESLRDEIATVLRDGFGAEEFEQSKRAWIQAQQVNRAQDGALANRLGLWTHVGRTMAWDAELEARVQALTVEEVRDAMRRHIDLAKMTFMRGGDFAAVSGASGQ
jgi:zinc protease